MKQGDAAAGRREATMAKFTGSDKEAWQRAFGHRLAHWLAQGNAMPPGDPRPDLADPQPTNEGEWHDWADVELRRMEREPWLRKFQSELDNMEGNHEVLLLQKAREDRERAEYKAMTWEQRAEFEKQHASELAAANDRENYLS